MQKILKLEKDNEKKEIDFELDYLTSLTVEQRFKMMFKKSEEMKKMLADKRNGEYRRTFKIIKRK